MYFILQRNVYECLACGQARFGGLSSCRVVCRELQSPQSLKKKILHGIANLVGEGDLIKNQTTNIFEFQSLLLISILTLEITAKIYFSILLCIIYSFQFEKQNLLLISTYLFESLVKKITLQSVYKYLLKVKLMHLRIIIFTQTYILHLHINQNIIRVNHSLNSA